METKLTRICQRLMPGTTLLALWAMTFLGLGIGGAIGAVIEGPAAFVALFGGTFGLPLIVHYIGLKDGRLSDDDCRELLDAAETPAEQALVRDLYCQKGCLMKSDASRIRDQVLQRQHADLQVRMGCA